MIDFGIPLIARQGGCFIDRLDRFKHLYCLGATRSGKSNFLLGLARQELDHAMLVLDPAGTFAPYVASLAPKDRLVYVDVNHPFRINPLSRSFYKLAEGVGEFRNSINNIVRILNDIQSNITPKMENIMFEALSVFDHEQSTLGYLTDFLEFWKVREKHFHKTPKTPFWLEFDKTQGQGSAEARENRASATRVVDRLKIIKNNKILMPFLDGQDQFNLDEIIAGKKILCFDLKGLFPEYKLYIGSFIMRGLLDYLAYAKETNNPFYVYIDEFHLFVHEAYALDDFLTGCGKFNISINLAHQSHERISPSLLSSVLGNTYVKTVFRAGDKDMARMAAEFNIPKDELRGIGKYEAYTLIGNKPHKHLTYYAGNIKPYQPETPPGNKTYNFLRVGWM